MENHSISPKDHQKPKLILMSGPPGAGKSTLCRALAKALPAIHLDKDAIDEPFSPNLRDENYNQNIEPKVLEALFNLASLNLGVGHWVLLDVPWTHILLNEPKWQDRVKEVHISSHADLVVIECMIPEAELRKRIEKRGYLRDQNKLTDEGWESFRKRDRLGEINPFPHFRVDMLQAPAQCFQSVYQHLVKKAG